MAFNNDFHSQATVMNPQTSNDFDKESYQKSKTQTDSVFDDESFKDMQNKVSQVPIQHKMTIIDTIQCNDGVMSIEITSVETQGSGTSKHTSYHVQGRDSLGDIDVFRRYREFLQFRDILFSRYPGLVIPPIPPKQATNKTQEIFVEERRYFLDQFLQKLSATPYLASTPEIQVFLRPQGKTKESLDDIPRTTTD